MVQVQHWLPVSSRIAAALVGGYVFTWGLTALIVAVNLIAGGDYDEGITLAYLLAFLVYLCTFLWAFATASLMRAWLILGGGGAAMTGAAWALTQSLGLPH